MGAFLAYTVYSGIFLLAGYLIYKWVMASEKQSTLNRSVLLGIYALSFAAMPLSAIRLGGAGEYAATAAFGTLQFISSDTAAAAPLWPVVLLVVYIAGLAVVLLWTLIVAVRLAVIISSGRRIRHDGYTLVLLERHDVAPFSWGRFIVMTESDYSSAGSMITAHELAHIRYGHCVDLIMAQIVCIILWYNPAAWLMREELKTVHEYQADGAVIDSGVDARQYQMLLIKKAVGTRFQSLANSLNHSKLKQRITMMYKEKNSGLRRLRGLVLSLAPVVALAVVNIPVVAHAISGLGEASLEAPVESVAAVSADKVSENPANSVDVQPEKKAAVSESLASYPGGEKEMFLYLSTNIRYPAAAAEKNIQGRSVIGFTVEADGSLSGFKVVKSAGALLDQEATRVIASMPNWNPAMKDGVAVASQYVLPVDFKLMGDEKKNDAEAEAAKSGATVLDDINVVSYGKENKSKATKSKMAIDVSTLDGGVVVIVDGNKMSVDEMKKIKPSMIESIMVRKDQEEYPDGVIYVTLKK